MNSILAKHVIEELLRAGVKEWVLCPGARNAPIVQLLIHSRFPISYWPEERSASFYALGKARRLKAPVAVVVTSGTAAGELLPAMMEAYYSGVPLVAVTADRPKRFRHSGAPQTAEQVNLYGVYAPLEFDLEGDELLQLRGWSQKGPLHLNVCFEEPARQSEATLEEIKEFYPKSKAMPQDIAPLLNFMKRSRQPLIIVGGLDKEEQPAVFRFLMEMGAPVYLEAPSGLREMADLQRFRVYLPELNHYDGVLRIGKVPTHKIWRDLEAKRDLIELLSISGQPFAGLSWAKHQQVDLVKYLEAVEGPCRTYERSKEFWEMQKSYAANLQTLLAEEPLSEAAFIHRISHQFPKYSHIYLGNSLPIREWDLAACNEPRGYEVNATRGLNGIDGQISSFFGLSDAGKFNAAIIGDLTALYDFAGFWCVKQLSNLPYCVFILNNQGGKIFSGMFPEAEIQNSHQLAFKPIADFWGVEYRLFDDIPESFDFSKRGIVELRPNAESSARFNQKHACMMQEIKAIH